MHEQLGAKMNQPANSVGLDKASVSLESVPGRSWGELRLQFPLVQT